MTRRWVVIISGSVRDALFAQPLVGALEDPCVFAPRESLSVLRLQTVGRGFATRPGPGLIRGWRRLRGLPATVLVVPPPVSRTSAILAYLSGVRQRVVTAGPGDWWATDRVSVGVGKHPVDTMARLASHILQQGQAPRAPRLEPGEGARQRLDSRLQSAGIGSPDRVLLAIPGHGNWVQRGTGPLWPPERFAVLANQLHPDLLIVVRGAGDERRVREVRAGVALRTAVVDLQAIVPEELAALARRSLAVIGHDGDALHAAAAGGGRTLALLGPAGVAPYGPEAMAVRVNALELTPARDVIEAARRHLEEPSHV